MRIVLAALLIIATFVPTASAKPPLDYKDPPPDALVGVGPFQRLPAFDESPAIVVATRTDPYWKAATFDPVLTNACKLGDFTVLPLNTLVVRFATPGKTAEAGTGLLQIVPPDRRHLLIDARKLAAPGETYYFEDGTYPDCRVWVGNLVRPRRLSAAGTSLPPADPLALKKREAEIKSWPQTNQIQGQPSKTP